MWKELGKQVGRRKLRKELAEREGAVMEFGEQQAQEAWIFYILDGEDTFHGIRELEERMKEGLSLERVRCFADLMGEEVPDFATGARNTDFIRPSEVGWTGRWKGEEIGEEEKPDLLIDLSDGRSLPLDRLMSELDGVLRIGRYRNDRLPHYDLMIESEEDEGVHDLGERILRYLQLMMKKGS